MYSLAPVGHGDGHSPTKQWLECCQSDSCSQKQQTKAVEDLVLFWMSSGGGGDPKPQNIQIIYRQECSVLPLGQGVSKWDDVVLQAIGYFWGPFGVIAIVYAACAYSAHCGPLAEMNPSGWVGLCCCFLGGSYQG